LNIIREVEPQEQVPITPVVTWDGAPTPTAADAVAVQNLLEVINDAGALPAQVGEVPEFDTAFDAQIDAGQTVPYVQAPDVDALMVDVARLDRIVQGGL
jgi:hypothetical protein